VLVVDKSTDHDKPHFDFFYHNINIKENGFLERMLKMALAGITRQIDAGAAWYGLLSTMAN